MYELPKNRMVPKRPVCGFSGMTQKTCSPICGFTGICHCAGVEGVKCAIVCYFQDRILNLTNLLNHLVHFIELVMQM